MAMAITREQAAAELSCSLRTVDRLRARGELDEIELSGEGGVRILTASLTAFLERKRNLRRGEAAEPGRSGLDVSNVRASVRASLRERKAARG